MHGKEKFSQEISWGFVFTFGKHDGDTIEEVLESDPSYIVWLNDETDHIVLPEIVDKAEENDFFNKD